MEQKVELGKKEDVQKGLGQGDRVEELRRPQDAEDTLWR